MRALIRFVSVAACLACVAVAAPAQQPAPPAFTAAGETLRAKYETMLERLRGEIAEVVPTVDEGKKIAYLKARDAEKAAEAAVAKAQQALDKANGAAGLVNHRKNKWIAGADKAIAETQAKLAKATTDAEREAAKAELATFEANKAEGQKALVEAEAALAQAQLELPGLTQNRDAAQQSLAAAQAATLKTVDAFGLRPFLSKDSLDAKLVKFEVLSQATPAGLAEFAQQGPAQEKLVERLLADDGLMKRMVAADGAKGGKYGRAMEIYEAIQQASPKAREGVLQRLALGTSLEHAVPVKQANPAAKTDGPAFVDPVKRYQHFEQAFLAGELDPCFEKLAAWEYRMAVNGDESDEMLGWGREMLRNYRPDHVATADDKWRYVAAVRTDVQFGSQNVKFDSPELYAYQNIINNGGVCGRRAFFGRYILRCFGVPTIPRPQPGHASLAHWTPDGWVINLGGCWGVGTTPEGKDLDFLARTQARTSEEGYLPVQRAQWIGDALGEKRAYGFHGDVSGLWNGVALYLQRAIATEAKAKTLAAVGTDLGEANESKVKNVEQVVVTDADRKVTVAADGTITVPAVACTSPAASTGKVIFMKSHGGGMQLHSSRIGEPQPIDYTIDVPRAGRYALTAKVVTVSPDQHLKVAANGSGDTTDIPLPYTIGKWEHTKPVEVTLTAGKNLVRFTRDEPVRGISIKEFALAPVK
jgi:hypothetical protein